MRFARFLEVSYIPAGRDDPGLSALPDGAKYYQFLIRRTTTTDLTADQIHQIGLDEVKKDEAGDAGHRAEARLQGSGELPAPASRPIPSCIRPRPMRCSTPTRAT